MQFQEFLKHQLGTTTSSQWRSFNTKKLFASKELCTVSVCKNHVAPVTCLSLEKQEFRYLLSGSAKGHIVIHDRSLLAGSNGFSTIADISWKRTGKKCIQRLQWYPLDTGMFFMQTENEIKVWDANQLQVAEQFHFMSKLSDMHGKEIGRNPLIAASSLDKSIFICDLATGSRTHTLTGHDSPVTAVKWSPRKEHVLYSGSTNGKINIWDVRKTKNLLKSLQTTESKKNGVDSISFTPNGFGLISLNSDGTLSLWKCHNGKRTKVNYAASSANNDRAGSTCVSNNNQVVFASNGQNVQAYDIYTGEHMKTFNGHFKAVTGVCYNDAFEELITCGLDSKVLIWDNRNYDKERLQNEYHQDDWDAVND